jgi:YcaO-like protein with predicted kinase domain
VADPSSYGILAKRTPKTYFAGTHRGYQPREVWDRIMPLFARFGISRISDITGLDRIGIPVATAIRPLSRSIAVAAGKGTDLIAAKVSAAMEAIECAHAEAIDRPLSFASRNEILRDRAAVKLTDLPLLTDIEIGDYARLTWIEGKTIADNEPIMVPYELVHAHFAPPGLPGSDAFLATTNGLASGSSIAEAVCHGLFEVIERDALNLWSRHSAAERSERLVDLAGIADPTAADALQRLDEAEFDIAVWDITSDLSLPVFHCMIVDLIEPGGHPGTGTGCHPDKNVALARALFEAVQVRAIYISGGRDDLSRREYEVAHMQSFRHAVSSQKLKTEVRRRYANLPSRFTEYFEDDLEWTLSELTRVGAGPAIVVDLSQPETGVAVVRVIVPGLEGPLESDVQAGERAKQIAR